MLEVTDHSYYRLSLGIASRLVSTSHELPLWMCFITLNHLQLSTDEVLSYYFQFSNLQLSTVRWVTPELSD